MGRREDEEGLGSSDPSSSFGLNMGPFASSYHGNVEQQNQYSANPYPYAVHPPPEGMRPRYALPHSPPPPPPLPPP